MAWQSDKLKDAHKEMVDKIIADMEAGKVFFWDSQHFGRPPRNVSSEIKNGRETRRYHGKNNLILSVAAMQNGYKDSRWGTYEAIKKEGGQVKKGEKATLIELWIWDKPVRHKNSKTGKWETVYKKDENGHYLLDFNGKKIPKTVHLDVPIVKGIPVFNAEQATGLPPEHEITINVADRQEKMERIIAGSEAPVYNDQSNRNYYTADRDEIHVMRAEDFKHMSGYYATVIHEIAHSTGAEKRLNRDGIAKGEGFGSPSYAKEELVAEMSSLFVAQEFDLKFDDTHYENHAAYLQSWIAVLKDNPDELYKAAEQAEKAVTYIKEHMLDKKKGQAVAEEQGEYKYYLDQRPVDIGAVPNGFSRFDEEDKGGRYGAIYYKGKLTDKQVKDYELRPAVQEKAVVKKLTPKEKLAADLKEDKAVAMAR